MDAFEKPATIKIDIISEVGQVGTLKITPHRNLPFISKSKVFSKISEKQWKYESEALKIEEG